MRRARQVLTGLLFLLAGCGTPDNVVVLLDDPAAAKGKGIEVTTPNGSRVIDTSNEAVDLTAKDIAQGKALVLDASEVREAFGPAIAAVPKAPVRYVVYFENKSTDLTPESVAELPRIVAEVKSRKAPDLSVVGHTDTTGAEDLNYKLGLERAQILRDRLVAEGVSASIIEIDSHGKHNPLVPTPDNTPEPRNRRVEVVIR